METGLRVINLSVATEVGEEEWNSVIEVKGEETNIQDTDTELL
jgi:hypothetical protein